MKDVFVNKINGNRVDAPPFDGEAYRFHKKLPGYRPTPLRRLRDAEAMLAARAVWVKDESDRFGLPAFKVLGASWAVYRKLSEEFGVGFNDWNDITELRKRIGDLSPLELVTATDGNHGRGVARVASWFGLGARVFMPVGSAEARVEAIRSEGAAVSLVEGSYDDAVAAAAEAAGPQAWLIQDTAWPGYETVPGWIIEGYSTIGFEVDNALTALGEPPPDLVFVQIGVGSLAAAIVRHYRCGARVRHPRIVGVEPSDAACAFESARAGEPVSVPGPHRSVMAGLNCGTLSSIAWPLVRDGIDLFITIGDSDTFEAMRMLSSKGITSGESGAAGLAGLLVLSGRGPAALRTLGLIRPEGGILVISTEGMTDPVVYRRVVG
jgi:diaminopropionate ammonia-lyase